MSSFNPNELFDCRLLSTIIEHNVDDQVLGEYQADANFIKINSRSAEFAKSLTYAQRLSPLDPHSQLIGTYEASDLNIDRLIPWLTFEHENAHYRNLISGPHGLLIWRIYQSLSIGVRYLEFLAAQGYFPDIISQLPTPNLMSADSGGSVGLRPGC